MTFELKPHNRNVADDDLIADLKRVAQDLRKSSVTVDEYNERGRFRNTTLFRRFGSWSNALERAGLNKARNLHPKRASDDALLADLKRIAAELHKLNVSRAEYNARGDFDSATLMRRFGSWSKALEKATPNPEPNIVTWKGRIPDDVLLIDLKRVAAELRRSRLTMTEYDEHGQFSSATLSERFGSWYKALEKAALDKTRNIHAKRILDHELLADLKRVAQELHKSSVTTDEYNERGRFSSVTLAERFGSWFKALEQAGLNKTRNLNISNEELFANLVAVWTGLGRQPSYSDLTSQTSHFSSGTYEKRFGGWRKALEAFVRWANKGENPPPRTPSGADRLPRRTSRNINYRLKFLVMRRDNFKCRITGRSPATDPTVILEVDHIVPWDKGGETVMENLQTLAKDVNIGKSNLSMDHDDY